MDTSARREIRPRRARGGQALTELAIGLFAFALVVAALLGFAKCITASLDMRRNVRAEAGRRALGSGGGDGISYSSSRKSASVTVSPLAADRIFGTERVELKEEVHIPHMKIAP